MIFSLDLLFALLVAIYQKQLRINVSSNFAQAYIVIPMHTNIYS